MDELLGHVLEGLMIGLAVVCHGRIRHHCGDIQDANGEDVWGNYYL